MKTVIDMARYLTDSERDKLNNLLYDEIVESITKDNDGTVLFEIIQKLPTKVAFWSLSDEGQERINYPNPQP